MVHTILPLSLGQVIRKIARVFALCLSGRNAELHVPMSLLARIIGSFQQPDLLADAVAEIVRACGHIQLDAKTMAAVLLPRTAAPMSLHCKLGARFPNRADITNSTSTVL